MRQFADANETYQYTKTVRFQGNVIALAMRESTKDIYYRVLDVSVEVPEDEQAWTNLRQLSFPDQLRPVGMSVLTLDIDPIQSTANAPFEVVADAQHVYVFRQSQQGTLYVNRFVFDSTANELRPNLETRYQRSRKRDVPAGRRDTLGFRDLEEQNFLEPTTELAMVDHLEQGRFAVLIIPSTLPGEERWLIVAYNDATAALDAFSIRRSGDGLFDLTQYDPDQHRTSFRLSQLESGTESNDVMTLPFQSRPAIALYMKQEDMIDEYGRRQRVKRDARVMLAIAVGESRQLATIDFAVSQGGTIAQLSDIAAIPPLRAAISQVETEIAALERQRATNQEYALNFNADGNHVVVNDRANAFNPSQRLWSVEAWIRTTTLDGTIVFKGDSQAIDFYQLSLEDGRAAFTVRLGGSDDDRIQVTSDQAVNDDEWHHLVAVRRAVRTLEIWVDGELAGVAQGTGDSISIDSRSDLRIGQALTPETSFRGQIDQVRIWRVARTEDQIRGVSPTVLGLVANWSFNEGQGRDIANARGNRRGRLTRVDADTWVRSERRLERSLIPLQSRLVELRGQLRRAISERRLILPSIQAEQALPQIYTDPMGLTVNGGILDFASTQATPTLFESNDGLLHLYFQGAQNEFFVAQYNISTQKATYTVRTEEQLVDRVQQDEIQFIARWSGTAMNQATIRIEDQGTDLCRVTLEATVSGNRVVADDESDTALPETQVLRETWEGLPRNPAQFISILNGAASQDLNEPDVEAGRRAYYDYAQARSLYHLPTGPGVIRFIARHPQGLGFDSDAAITIDGDHPQFCTMTLDNGAGVVETWRGVPRNPQQCVAVLSGQASSDATDPLVQRGRRVYYSYDTPRDIHRLALANGQLLFVTLRDDSGNASIMIDGDDEAVCRVMLIQGEIKETWEGVPRDPRQFALVLNGNASSNPDDPLIQSGEQVFYDYRNARPTFLLDAGEGRIRFVRAMEDQLRAIANQSVGSVRDVTVEVTDTDADDLDPVYFCTVTLTARVGNRTIRELWNQVPREARAFSTVLSGRAIGSEYDYALAETEGFEADLINGSILFTVLADDLTEADAVENTSDRPITELRTVTITGASRNANRNGSVLFAVIDDGSVDQIENSTDTSLSTVRQAVVIRGTRARISNGSSLFAVMNMNASGRVLNHESDRPLPLQRVTQPLQELSSILQGTSAGLQSNQPLLGSTLFRLFTTTAFEQDSTARVELVDITGPDRLAVPGTDCSWIPEPPRNALQFNGVDHVQVQTSDSLDLDRDITIEGWVRPTSFTTPSRIITYNNGEAAQYLLDIQQNGQVLAATRDQVVITDTATIPPNEWTHLAATYDSSYAVQLDGANDFIDCGNNASLNVDDAITIEAWVTPERSGVEQVIASRWGTEIEQQSWTLFLDARNHTCFRVKERDNDRDLVLCTNAPLQVNQTYHVVGVFDGGSEEVSAVNFEGSQFINIAIDVPETETTYELWFKTSDPTGGLFRTSDGSANTRYDRTLYLFEGNLHARLGEEGGLRGPGHLSTQGRNFADNRWHHVAYVFGASVNGQRLYVDGELVAQSTLRAASNFAQSHVNIGFANDAGLSSGEAGDNYFTGLINEVRIWASARPLDDIRADMTRRLTGDEYGLRAYWPLNSIQNDRIDDRVGNQEGVATRGMRIRQDRRGRFTQRLWASLVDNPTSQQEITSRTGTQATNLETLRLGANVPAADGSTLAIADTDTDLGPGDIVLVNREQLRITGNGVRRGGGSGIDPFRLDFPVVRASNGIVRPDLPRGEQLYLVQYRENQISESTASVVFGAQADAIGYLQGKIHQVRLWNVGRFNWQLEADRDRRLTGTEEGLIGYWRFDEGEGTLAFDSRGQNHGRLQGGDRDELIQKWIPSPTGSRWTIYINGEAVESSAGAVAAYGDANHARLGGVRSNNNQALGFVGVMDDVRIWNVTRTAEQIRDSLYRPLVGNEDGLIAYWRFDDGSAGAIAADLTVNGNDGQLSNVGMRQPSNAPISNEGPEVINVLSPVTNQFNRRISGQPAIAEYGDVQFDIDGNLIGVLKRCYVYTDAQTSQVQLVTGYKIGDLELQFIGQVQSRPTLIGYIEGAPPVPSENLTVQTFRPYLYVGNTSVELMEADNTVQVYSASMDSGVDTSFDFKGGLYANIEVDAGVGVLTETFKLESKLGLHTTFEASNGWTRDASLSVSSGTNFSNSLALGGALEETADYDNNGILRYLNPTVGQRFVPANVGYALVRSGTANLFATRLKQTGALVSFQTIPNPDIPEDVNIIIFPINPQYTKNGTLDGRVGLVNDPDYPNADSDRGSYFKPLEAYALREQIEREKQDILAYYDQYNVGQQASTIRSQRRGGLTAEFPNLEGLRDLSQEGEDEGVGSVLPDARFREQLAQRSLVNTYVWTADGGLYAEEEEFSSIRQESLGRYFANQGQLGFSFEIEAAAGLGGFAELDALFGGHLDVTVVKDQAEQSAFGLKVQVEGDGFINQFDPETGEYLSTPAPGKVDTYRFMSFYLAPKADHFDTFFDTVVDPNWLRNSQDANARALREAEAEKNRIWRVMHRVTFVSRIPPQFDEPSQESQDGGVRRPANLGSNDLILDLVRRQVVSRSPQPREIGVAVDRVFDQDLKDQLLYWSEFLNRAQQSYQLPATPNPENEAFVRLVARPEASDIQTINIQVENGLSPTLCTVRLMMTLNHPAPNTNTDTETGAIDPTLTLEEVWSNVSRNPQTFVNTLTGTESSYNYGVNRGRSLEVYPLQMSFGREIAMLSQIGAVQAVSIHIEDSLADSSTCQVTLEATPVPDIDTPNPQPSREVWPQVSRNQQEFIDFMNRNSDLFAVLDNGSSGQVRNQGVTTVSRRSVLFYAEAEDGMGESIHNILLDHTQSANVEATEQLADLRRCTKTYVQAYYASLDGV